MSMKNLNESAPFFIFITLASSKQFGASCGGPVEFKVMVNGLGRPVDCDCSGFSAGRMITGTRSIKQYDI